MFSFRWRGWCAVLVFGGWLVSAFLVGIVGAGVFLVWAFVYFVRALAVGCFFARGDLLARDYFLLALVDWLVIGFWRWFVAGDDWLLWWVVFLGRFVRGARGGFLISCWRGGVFALQVLGGCVIAGRFLVVLDVLVVTVGAGTILGLWEIGGFCWRAGTLARDYFLLVLDVAVFGGVDCVARGIRCVVCHWFWRLAGAG